VVNKKKGEEVKKIYDVQKKRVKTREENNEAFSIVI
jgi:hypothetical protein